MRLDVVGFNLLRTVYVLWGVSLPLYRNIGFFGAYFSKIYQFIGKLAINGSWKTTQQLCGTPYVQLAAS